MQEGDTVTWTIYDGREPRRGTVTKVTDTEVTMIFVLSPGEAQTITVPLRFFSKAMPRPEQP